MIISISTEPSELFAGVFVGVELNFGNGFVEAAMVIEVCKEFAVTYCFQGVQMTIRIKGAVYPHVLLI